MINDYRWVPIFFTIQVFSEFFSLFLNQCEWINEVSRFSETSLTFGTYVICLIHPTAFILFCTQRMVFKNRVGKDRFVSVMVDIFGSKTGLIFINNR